jgi:hypothetical protein
MRFIAFLAALAGSAIAVPLESRSSAVGEFFNVTLARAGDLKDVVIRKENTLNATSDASTPASFGRFTYTDGQKLRLAFVNNFGGGPLNAYITALTMNGQVVVLGSNGQWVYPKAYGSKSPTAIKESISHPLSSRGGTVDLTLPDYVASARVWFAEGQLTFSVTTGGDGRDGIVQPDYLNPTDVSANVNWGFVELTHKPEGIWANLSFVDFVGMEVGMKINRRDGTSQTTPGLRPGAVRSICKELIEQSKVDNQPWNKLCVADSRGNPLRILSPEHYKPMKESNYWSFYIETVWAVYARKPLKIDTGNGGVVNCQVSGGILKCGGGDNRGYEKPSTSDIWGCDSGPFRNDNPNEVHKIVVSHLCAGFVRSTLLLDGGDLQPNLGEWNYYKGSVTHHYSRLVHQYEVNNIGYAFSYDDVVLRGGIETSGILTGQADLLTIYVGGVPS